MNAKELFTKEGKAAGVFYCDACRSTAASVETAERCCRCSYCNEHTHANPGGAYYFTHKPCEEKARAAALEKRIDMVEKLK
jgi:hypothetical protein